MTGIFGQRGAGPCQKCSDRFSLWGCIRLARHALCRYATPIPVLSLCNPRTSSVTCKTRAACTLDARARCLPPTQAARRLQDATPRPWGRHQGCSCITRARSVRSVRSVRCRTATQHLVGTILAPVTPGPMPSRDRTGAQRRQGRGWSGRACRSTRLPTFSGRPRSSLPVQSPLFPVF